MVDSNDCMTHDSTKESFAAVWREILWLSLVVDDEEHIRLLYSEELKEDHATMINTPRKVGMGCRTHLNSDKPDLVVLRH